MQGKNEERKGKSEKCLCCEENLVCRGCRPRQPALGVQSGSRAVEGAGPYEGNGALLGRVPVRATGHGRPMVVPAAH